MDADIFQCGICLEVMKKPKILKCFHSFCLECLLDYVDKRATGNMFKCPFCREAHEVPENGAAGFQDNFYIGAAAGNNANEPPAICEICEKSDVQALCVECNQKYCSECTELHLKMKVSREDHIVNPSTSDPAAKMLRKTYCLKHSNEELKFYCADCSVPICRDCTVTKHRNHSCQDIEDAAEVKREELRKVLEEGNGDSLIQILKTRTQQTGETRKRLAEEVSDACNKIEGHLKEVKSELDSKAEETISKLKMQHRWHDQVLAERQVRYQKELKAVEKTAKSVQIFIENSSDAELSVQSFDVKKILGPKVNTAVYLEEKVSLSCSFPSVSSDALDKLSASADIQVKLEDELDCFLHDSIDIGDHCEPVIICPVTGKQTWVACGQELHLFDVDEDLCVDDEEVDVHETVFHMCRVPSEDDDTVFIACRSSLMKISIEGTVTEFGELFNLPDQPNGLAVISGGEFLVSFSDRNQIQRLTAEGKFVEDININKATEKPIVDSPRKISFSPNGHLVVLGRERMHVLDPANFCEVRSFAVPPETEAFTFTEDGHIIYATFSGEMVLLSEEGLFMMMLADIPEPASVEFIPGSKKILLGDSSGTLQVYHFR